MKSRAKIHLDLLVYALIFVIVTVVFTAVCITPEKVAHLVFVKAQRAGIFLGVLVIYVEFAAFTA